MIEPSFGKSQKLMTLSTYQDITCVFKFSFKQRKIFYTQFNLFKVARKLFHKNIGA